MALPKAAQKQVEEANRILQELDSGRKEALRVVEEKQPPAPTAAEPEVTPPPEVTPVAEATPPAPEASEAPPKSPESVFENKYKVLQGKYDSEVPRLHRQVSDLNQKLEEMQGVLASMSAAPAAQPAVQTSLVTPAEIDEYGADLIDLVGRRAKEVYEPAINELRSQISGLKKQLGGVTQEVGQTSREKMLSQLGGEVEDWEVVNKQPEFLSWLAEPDPYSGTVRGTMLRTAYERNDTGRVIAFFKGFKQEHAVVSPPSTGDSEPLTATPRTPAVDLNTQVAPGRAPRASTQASAQAEKRIWTKTQIAEFYSDVQRGKFKGDEARKTAIERDIIFAANQGRIRD